MMRSIIQSGPVRLGAAIFLTLAVAFGIYSVALAAYTTSISTPAPANCTGGANVDYTVTWFADGPAWFGVQITNVTQSLAGPTNVSPYGGGPAGPVTTTGLGWNSTIPGGTVAGDTLRVTAMWWSDAGITLIPGSTSSFDYDCSTGQSPAGGGTTGGGGAAVEPPARTPAIWLADVCEPNDGFSGDGWMTIGSDVNELPFDHALYVAPSIDGPWMGVELPGPPYIVNREMLDIVASAVGVADYHEIWVRASSMGQPAKIGSMIIDRSWRMTQLCGG